MLGEYIKDATGRRFEWGVHDCCTFAARWIEIQTGRDPMATFPPYSSEAEAGWFVQNAGGLAALWERQLAGIASQCGPCVGSIGIVRTPDGHELGGIRSEERWVFLTDAGIKAMTVPPERVIAAWCAHG